MYIYHICDNCRSDGFQALVSSTAQLALPSSYQRWQKVKVDAHTVKVCFSLVECPISMHVAPGLAGPLMPICAQLADVSS